MKRDCFHNVFPWMTLLKRYIRQGFNLNFKPLYIYLQDNCLQLSFWIRCIYTMDISMVLAFHCFSFFPLWYCLCNGLYIKCNHLISSHCVAWTPRRFSARSHGPSRKRLFGSGPWNLGTSRKAAESSGYTLCSFFYLISSRKWILSITSAPPLFFFSSIMAFLLLLNKMSSSSTVHASMSTNRCQTETKTLGMELFRNVSICLCTLGARGFLREEPRSGKKRRKKVRKPLVACDSWLILPHQQIWNRVEIWPCLLIGGTL